MAESLGWTLKGFREAFLEALREGLVKTSWKDHFAWIPNAISYNKPESPNVIIGWSATWDEMPECDLKLEAFRGLESAIKAMGEPFRKAFAKALPKPSWKPSWKPMPNQEQEQEQEQEEDSLGRGHGFPSSTSQPAVNPHLSETASADASAFPTPARPGVSLGNPGKETADGRPDISVPKPPPPTPSLTLELQAPGKPSPVIDVFEHWKARMEKTNAAKLSPKRERAIRARLKDGFTLAQLCQAVDGCAVTPHNMGENERGEKYDDIELICRDIEHVERFIANAQTPPKPKNKNSAYFENPAYFDGTEETGEIKF